MPHNNKKIKCALKTFLADQKNEGGKNMDGFYTADVEDLDNRVDSQGLCWCIGSNEMDVAIYGREQQLKKLRMNPEMGS